MCTRSDLNASVQKVLDALVDSGEEIGLQVAAYVDGELVVDAWAGVTDEISGKPVNGDTLFTSWSTTKGFVSTCIHILGDRGLIDYDTSVDTYWPEFATHGKDKITVRHVLSHSSGIPHMPEDVTPEMITDWDAMCTAIANLKPLWPPGNTTHYHFWTWGWIIGEVIRRVDGRPVFQFVQEELCQPLGINDFYLGIPNTVEHRVAPVREERTRAAKAPDKDDLALRVTPPQITRAEIVNRPDVRRACIPAIGGIMNARAIARHYAMLSGYGELDGTRILSKERVDLIHTLHNVDPAKLLEGQIPIGLGYLLGGSTHHDWSIAMGETGGEFGHPGHGGSLGFADPNRNIGFGLTKNLMKEGDETVRMVAETIRNQLDSTA
ncbi:MAG: serine hydrolase domain-containing protein [Candidatus Thorarchaeota archaeon]